MGVLREVGAPRAGPWPRRRGDVVEGHVEVRFPVETHLHADGVVGDGYLALDADEARPDVVDARLPATVARAHRVDGRWLRRVDHPGAALEDVLDTQPLLVPLAAGREVVGGGPGVHRREQSRRDVRVARPADEYLGGRRAHERVALEGLLELALDVLEVVRDCVGLLGGEAPPLGDLVAFEPLDELVELHLLPVAPSRPSMCPPATQRA